MKKILYLIPFLILNSQVRLSVCFHDVASLGVTEPSAGFISVSVSVTFCLGDWF